MRRRSALPVAVLCALATISVVHGEKGRCLRAEVPAPFAFPDGSIHPAGPLTLCVSEYSPVAAYHKVLVNGVPSGMLFSQRREAEGQQGDQPLVLFRRADTGELRLLGYIWPEGKKSHAYLLQGEPWDARATSRVPAKETTLAPSGEPSALAMP